MLSPLGPDDEARLSAERRGEARRLAARLAAAGLDVQQVIAAVDAERGVRLSSAAVRAAIADARPSARLAGMARREGGVASARTSKNLVASAREGRNGVTPPDMWDAPGGPEKNGASGTFITLGRFGPREGELPLRDKRCRNILSGEGASALFCDAPTAPRSRWCAACGERLSGGFSALPGTRSATERDADAARAARMRVVKQRLAKNRTGFQP